MTIRNIEELLSHGNVEGRRIALDIIEHALMEIDSYDLVRKVARIEGENLVVDRLTFDLSRLGDVYVVGAGKGSFSIAKALENIMGDRIKKGAIIEKRGEKRRLRNTKVIEAGHPIPDEEGVRGAKEIVGIARNAGKGDLVFACITGGCSALMTLPAQGISLEDAKKMADLLLKCGAEIQEVNAVRKHISSIKGGRLALYIHPADVVTLVVVDEVRGLPWGPTVPDTTTFVDAISVLKKYDLSGKVPDSIREHLKRADPSQETPKANDFKLKGVRAHNIVLAESRTVCEAAKRRTKELGLNAMILSTIMEGESREAGIVLAGIAKEIEKSGRPLEPPCALIVGGETTVTIAGEPGEGGRNQEFALGAALKIDGSEGIVMASVGTDGTDGPTDIAGAIVDGYTLSRAREKGIDVYEELTRHNSSYVFRKIEDAIFTGPTGTNVMDLRLIVVLSREEALGSSIGGEGT